MKGVNLALYLVLAVVLIGLGIVFYNKIKSWSCVSDPFGCMSKKSDLEAAAECLMSTCLYGCASPETKSIKGDKFDCNNYCENNKKIIDLILDDDKLCGFQFPIEIQIPEEKTMKVDKKTIHKNYQCIFKFDGNPNTIRTLISSFNLLSADQWMIGIEHFDDSNYQDATTLSCPTSLEEKSSVEVKGLKTLYIYGDLTPFYPFVEENNPIPFTNAPMTFVTQKPLYTEIGVNEERKINLAIGKYYPLEKNYGLIIKNVGKWTSSCGNNYNPPCPSGEEIKICIKALCDDKTETIEICSQNDLNTQILICNGKYTLTPTSLPNDISNSKTTGNWEFVPYTFSVKRNS